LYDKVASTEVDMLAEVLPQLAAGRLPRVPQDAQRATTIPKRRPDDGAIDWTQPARRVFDWVRALTHPYPGAFCALDGRRLWIWKVEMADVPPPDAGAPPGLVALDARGWPLVASTDGWVRLL